MGSHSPEETIAHCQTAFEPADGRLYHGPVIEAGLNSSFAGSGWVFLRPQTQINQLELVPLRFFLRDPDPKHSPDKHLIVTPPRPLPPADKNMASSPRLLPVPVLLIHNAFMQMSAFCLQR